MIPAALEPQEHRLSLLLLHVRKAARDAAFEVLDALGKVPLKASRLGALDLAVLHSLPTEEVVQLDSLVGGGAVLILSRLHANPERNVPSQSRRVRVGLIGVQYDVGVAGVEVAVLGLGPGLDDKLLDAPDL